MSEASTRRGPGRRPGAPDTRAQILAAARECFGQSGYDGTTLRAVARAADVDPALVHHYFAGGKEQLFVEALELPFTPAVAVPDVVGDDLAGVGERVTRFFFWVWGDPERRAPFLALLRSAMSHEQAADMLRGFVTAALLDRVAAVVPGPDARVRIELAMSQLVGVALLRYVVRAEPLASASEEEVVALVAPTVQRYLAG